MSVDDPVFLNLYRELCFRHIYARVPGGPTIHQRFESYYNYCQVRDFVRLYCTNYNYCQLFNYILSAEKPIDLKLPNQWLWEMIDEFIYQFQVG